MIFWLMWLGCIKEPEPKVIPDNDGDGYTEDVDCDDGNAAVHPNAEEVCDGVDNNCDSVLLEDEVDIDGDGFLVCGNDCDDGNVTINPEANEICDSIDNDCDGTIDDEDSSLDVSTASTFYRDEDNDGFGDPDTATNTCIAAPGYVEDGTDCDDTAAFLTPEDTDGDGFSTCTGDCNDGDAAINPNAIEVCDNIDNDCNPNTVEDGLVSQQTQTQDGMVLTNIVVSTDPDNPTEVAISTPGEVYFCDGTYYPELTIEADVDLIGLGNQVVLSGTDEPIISVFTNGVNFSMHNMAINDFVTSPSTEGVALYCQTEAFANISLTDVVFQNNTVFILLFAENCNVTADNVSIDNTTAFYSGGFAVSNAYLSLSNSSITNGTVEVFGSVLVLDGSLLMDNTEISGNTSGIAIGFGGASTGEITNSRIISNQSTSDYPALLMEDTINLTVTQSDFGTAANGDDNSAADVAVDSMEYYVGDNIDFTCADGRCGTAVDDTIDADADSSPVVQNSKIRGNYFEVTGYPTLNSFGLQLECSEFGAVFCGSSLYYYVHTRSSSTDPWTLRSVDVRTDSWLSGSVVTSPDIGIILYEGEQVALSVGWYSSVVQYFYDDYVEETFELGTVLGGILQSDMTDIEDPGIYDSSYNSYYQTISTTRIE